MASHIIFETKSMLYLENVEENWKKKIISVFLEKLGYCMLLQVFISAFTSIFVHSVYICALFFRFEIIYMQQSDLHLQLYQLEDVIHYVISFSKERGVGETWHYVK